MTVRPPSWPRCHRCSKPSAPAHRVEHEGLVYCSVSCVDALKESRSQASLREAVFKRDQGVCDECRMDCVALRRFLDDLIDQGTVEAHHKLVARSRGLKGFPAISVMTKGESLWEAAHILARVEGGANTLDNCKTLCRACHREDTNRLASKRAASRRPDRPWPKRKIRG